MPIPRCMRYACPIERIRFLAAARFWPALWIACLLLAGCTIQDVLRATLGGADSNEAHMNKINPKNQSFFPNDK